MQGEENTQNEQYENYNDVQVEVQETDDHSDGPKNEFAGLENEFSGFN